MRNVSEYLTEKYVEGETLVQIRSELVRKKNILLKNFFIAKKMSEILKEINKSKLKEKYIPNQYKYSYLSPAVKMQKEVQLFFSFLLSQTFRNYVSFITGKKISTGNICVKIYDKGCYKLIHDTPVKERIRAIIDLTPFWENLYGGTFGIHDGKEFLTIPLKQNDLSIILCNKNTRDFVLYVKHFAKRKKRVFVQVSFS